MLPLSLNRFLFFNLSTLRGAYHDTNDRVKIGPFSRGGKSRTNTQAVDHDFGNEFITPFGILDVSNNQLHLEFTKSKMTADFMVDAIEA
nr:hypothetical protein [Tepidibacillus fermentans]